jgi:hypothetical protein
MPYKLSWFIPGRVIDMTLPEIATDGSVFEALDTEINAMLDSGTAPVHVMIDVRTMKEFPSATIAMKMKYYKHPKVGRLVIIGLSTNPMLRFLAGLVGRGVGVQIKDMSTREEAEAYIATLEHA